MVAISPYRKIYKKTDMNRGRQSKKLLTLGFGIIGLLFFIFSFGWIYTIYDGQNKIQKVIKEKEEEKLVSDLKTITLKRNIATIRMILMNDAFDRDEQYMYMRSLGAEFIRIRQILESNYFDEYDIEYWKGIRQPISLGERVQKNIVELLVDDKRKEAEMHVNELFKMQDNINSELNNLTNLVDQEVSTVIRDVKNASQVYYYIAGLTLFIAIVTGFVVIRYVLKNIQKSEKLLVEYGYKIREIYNISAEAGTSNEDQIQHMLVTGCQILDMDYAYIVQADSVSNSKRIIYEFSRGMELNKKSIDTVNERLCDFSLYSNNSISMFDMNKSIFWNKDKSVLNDIRACISSPFKVDNKNYGVLCFLNGKPHKPLFTAEDSDLVKLMSSWIGFTVERNIDNERQIELIDEAEKANIAKSEFLGNMSHELRTPMHAILSYSGFGITRFKTADDEKKLKYFSKIQKSANSLLLLLNDILDLSKLQADKMEFDFSENNFNETVADVVDELSELAIKNSLSIDYILKLDEECFCYDNGRIKQVIRNLLSNALKFSTKGNIINIKAIRNESSVHLSVSDTGIGIPEEELIEIFDKFKQSSKTKTGAGGTGLGLAICREIIEYHHGQIWAESNLMGGATFNVVIPLNLENISLQKVS